MPSVEELLSQTSEEVEAYADTGIEYCTVDDDTRLVTIPDKYKKLGVESDEKAKRIWFRFPKLVGNNGVDLSAIGVRVNFRNANGEGDIYIVEDLTTDGDYVTFSWELTRKVTAYKGNVSFVVCAVKSNTDGMTKNEWNTTLNKECEVLEGLEVTEQIEQENPDIIEYILANLGGSVSAEQIAQAVEEYLAENPPFGMTADEKAQLNKNTEDISQLSKKKVDQTQLINAVNNALTEAKESGEFDGAKGDKGDTGEQGVRGEKGETGATGEKGADGTSVTVSSVSESPEDGGSNIVTFSDGTKLTVKNGSKGSQGEKGEQGIQGIQGEKGDKGDTGETGANGKDYVLTEADKEEIARMIDEVLILTEAELEALTQEELAEKYEKGTKILIIKESENLVHIAISPSGEIYNGCGYLSGYRLNSSGGISESENSAMTGFIPYVYGSEIHISGGLQVASYGGQYLNAYNENFELLASLYLDGAISNSGGSSSFDDKNIRHDIVKTARFSNSTYANAFKNASYIRIALNPCVGKDIVVSYN